MQGLMQYCMLTLDGYFQVVKTFYALGRKLQGDPIFKGPNFGVRQAKRAVRLQSLGYVLMSVNAFTIIPPATCVPLIALRALTSQSGNRVEVGVLNSITILPSHSLRLLMLVCWWCQMK